MELETKLRLRVLTFFCVSFLLMTRHVRRLVFLLLHKVFSVLYMADTHQKWSVCYLCIKLQAEGRTDGLVMWRPRPRMIYYRNVHLMDKRIASSLNVLSSQLTRPFLVNKKRRKLDLCQRCARMAGTCPHPAAANKEEPNYLCRRLRLQGTFAAPAVQRLML